MTEVQWIVINNLHKGCYKMYLPQKLAVHGVCKDVKICCGKHCTGSRDPPPPLNVKSYTFVSILVWLCRHQLSNQQRLQKLLHKLLIRMKGSKNFLERETFDVLGINQNKNRAKLRAVKKITYMLEHSWAESNRGQHYN